MGSVMLDERRAARCHRRDAPCESAIGRGRQRDGGVAGVQVEGGMEASPG